MADAPKTQPTTADPAAFIAAISDPRRRADAERIAALMQEATGEPPVMWGPSIVGFGRYHYQGRSGRSGDWMLTAFSPRKANFSLYLNAGFDQYADLLARLGKHKTGVGCLYINRLADVDEAVLFELITKSAEHMRATEAVD